MTTVSKLSHFYCLVHIFTRQPVDNLAESTVYKVSVVQYSTVQYNIIQYIIYSIYVIAQSPIKTQDISKGSFYVVRNSYIIP